MQYYVTLGYLSRASLLLAFQILSGRRLSANKAKARAHSICSPAHIVYLPPVLRIVQ